MQSRDYYHALSQNLERQFKVFIIKDEQSNIKISLSEFWLQGQKSICGEDAVSGLTFARLIQMMRDVPYMYVHVHLMFQSVHRGHYNK